MTNEQIVQIVAAVIAAITPARKTPAIKSKINRFTPKLSPAVVDPRTERQLNRLAAVAKAFNRKGIKNNDMKFKTDSNPTDYNIRTYKGWLTVGRIVKRGEHGVKGLFHISQTKEIVQPKSPSIPNPTIGMPVQVVNPN